MKLQGVDSLLVKGQLFYGIKYLKTFDNLFIYWGFTPLSTLFQLYHGDSSLIHDPWVNKPVLG